MHILQRTEIMRPIIGDITKIIHGIMLRNGGEILADIDEHWSSIVGNSLHTTTYPVRLVNQNGQLVLYISAANAVASFEINCQQQLILDNIASLIGHRKIQRLKCSICP